MASDFTDASHGERTEGRLVAVEAIHTSTAF